MRVFLVLISLLFPLSQASAGVTEGDFFGYKLGSAYPISKSTKGYMQGLGSMVLFAEKPEMSTDFQRVELIVTPKTYTIANIYATVDFEDEAKAKAFALRYADLLGTLHGTKCPEHKAYLGEALSRICSGIYELSVNHFKPSDLKEKHKVQVGLKFSNTSAKGEIIIKQFSAELGELESEGKRQRLEDALKNRKMKGLE
jgi:hypothetical protein